MGVFAIADLHLSLGEPKPMDIFGAHWENHHKKIEKNWRRNVSDDDWVLVCGDISWAMDLKKALLDLDFIAGLPGKKILIRGNHDYWWKGISKLRNALPQGMFVIQNDFVPIGKIAVCGSRGWLLPHNNNYLPEDEKIYNRELLRAEMSLKKAEVEGYGEKLFMMHFPPFNNGVLDPGYRKLFNEYRVKWCVYGHLHGPDHRFAVEGNIDGIEYRFVACDYTDFAPVKIID
ncbi:MAG: serine/threonine protein phosphatase [Clostridia bacterium]|nr:serine/threonine protein phosphatase [Clostridia bacterium]